MGAEQATGGVEGGDDLPMISVGQVMEVKVGMHDSGLASMGCAGTAGQPTTHLPTCRLASFHAYLGER